MDLVYAFSVIGFLVVSVPMLTLGIAHKVLIKRKEKVEEERIDVLCKMVQVVCDNSDHRYKIQCKGYLNGVKVWPELARVITNALLDYDHRAFSIIGIHFTQHVLEINDIKWHVWIISGSGIHETFLSASPIADATMRLDDFLDNVKFDKSDTETT